MVSLRFLCLDEPVMPDVCMLCIIVKASVSQVSSFRGSGQSLTTVKLFGRAL